MRLFYLLTFSLLLFTACESSSVRIKNEGFPLDITLQPQKIKIKEILKPGAMIFLDDFLVIQQEYNHGEDCFFIYTSDSMEFCFSFGRLGQSGTDNEFVAPRLMQNCSGNTLVVFDQYSRKMNYYLLDKNNFSLIKQERIMDNSISPLQELSFVNDSIILFTTSQYELCCYNLSTSTFIDILKFDYDLDAESSAQLQGFHFSNNGNQVNVGFMFFNVLKMGVLDSEYKFVFDNKKIKRDNWNFNQQKIYENPLYYMFTTTTNEFCYSQYMGLPFIEMQPFPLNLKEQNFKWLLEVYDTAQKKVALININQNLSRYTIDKKNRYLISWDLLNDFDYIYKYDLPQESLVLNNK